MTNQNRILFSSVIRPFGEKFGDGFTVHSILARQNLWAQDIYLVEAHGNHWGLDLIAENIKAPVRVLRFPSMSEFVEEIKKGYSHVALSYVPQTVHKLTPMLEAIRKYAPNSKIILGGTGTALDPKEFKLPHDYVCRGEGIAFMRSLLGEEEKAFSHPMVTIVRKLFSMSFLGEIGMIFGGLGCPNGCEFCVTSYYFDRKHISFLKSGKEIVDVILKYKQHHPQIKNFTIYDEDFLLDKKRGSEFVEESKKLDFIPQLTVFSSVKAVS